MVLLIWYCILYQWFIPPLAHLPGKCVVPWGFPFESLWNEMPTVGLSRNADFRGSGPSVGRQLVAATLYDCYTSPWTVCGPRQRKHSGPGCDALQLCFQATFQLKAWRKWRRRVAGESRWGGWSAGWVSVVEVVPLALEAVVSETGLRAVLNCG